MLGVRARQQSGGAAVREGGGGSHDDEGDERVAKLRRFSGGAQTSKTRLRHALTPCPELTEFLHGQLSHDCNEQHACLSNHILVSNCALRIVSLLVEICVLQLPGQQAPFADGKQRGTEASLQQTMPSKGRRLSELDAHRTLAFAYRKLKICNISDAATAMHVLEGRSSVRLPGLTRRLPGSRKGVSKVRLGTRSLSSARQKRSAVSTCSHLSPLQVVV